MARFDDLAAFAAVVRVGSFTRAAAQMGMTQSALSQTVRSLERRLDLKLLNRTTRSVSPTEAGGTALPDRWSALCGYRGRAGGAQ